MSKQWPLGEQPRPETEIINALGSGPLSVLYVSCPTPEMAQAYKAWLDSGDAHVAFGDWADGRGLE